MIEKVKVWFTLGVDAQGKLVVWGEPHTSQELAQIEAELGNERYTDCHVSKMYETTSPSRLFQKLLNEGIK